MKTVFKPGKLVGRMSAPASKSDTHRRMICAAMTHGQTELQGYMESEDVRATAKCLETLGAFFSVSGDVMTVRGHAGKPDLFPVFDCGESGSTLRFSVPLALSLCGKGIFRMHGRLGQRPMDVYRDLFVPRGVQWHMGEGADGAAELTVAGWLEPGKYSVPGFVSSQFISGLLFSLPLLRDASVLEVIPPIESIGYIRMTLRSLEQSGIQVQQQDQYTWLIPGGQHYNAVSERLEGDWSQAAVVLCADAQGSEVTVDGLQDDSMQGDREVLNCLEKMGASVIRSDTGVSVRKGKMRGIVMDMSNTPDIAPMLALVCQHAEGESRLTGCGRLRAKECDRLRGTVQILNTLGGCAREDGDSIVIRGVEKLRGGCRIDTQNDHRMVMLASIAALVCEKGIETENVEALNKSWPGYLDTYRALGGIAE